MDYPTCWKCGARLLGPRCQMCGEQQRTAPTHEVPGPPSGRPPLQGGQSAGSANRYLEAEETRSSDWRPGSEPARREAVSSPSLEHPGEQPLPPGRRRLLNKPIIASLYVVGVVLLLAGIALFSAAQSQESVPSPVVILLPWIGFLLELLSWGGVLVKAAQQRKWGCVLGTLLFGGLAVFYIQTTGRLVVSEDVTTTPPDARVTGKSAFAFLDEFDACTRTDLLSVEGFASEVDFQAIRVTQATLDATIDSEDVNNNPAPMTVHLSWQGVGGTTTSIITEYFKSPTVLMIFSNRGSTRSAIVTGTITVGTIVVAAPTSDGDAGGMSGDLSYGTQGSLQLSRS